ncbi:sulfur carrier protein ThiS [Saccharopolyspora rhizosphaerae]|uniref:Sulfur carrier protein ThiS n=1 Tax=Saccharopolyspora rhizosphaerae TaxID=2492662 RepID=A0A3R8QBL0_9PSEU|nr:sulfur carrier protein ThiS [Saccharopolyspora rhizosphaerae]RRO17312.1 sulfur carrier protein ThiS [Saccharopolyspora rhizosphaerae]
MNVMINGEAREVATGATLASVVDDFGVPERGVAVAVDGAVVPRVSWQGTALHADATIEVLTAVQGG